MSGDAVARGTPMRAFAATLATRELPRFTSADLLLTVNRLIESTGVAAALVPEMTVEDISVDPTRIWNRGRIPPKVGLRLNGVTVEIKGEDRAGFTQADIARLDVRSWRNARENIARSRAHVSVTELFANAGIGIDENFDRAAAVTVVTMAVARLVEAVGVVWQPSRCAVAAADLPQLFAGLEQGKAPAYLWVGADQEPAPRGAPPVRTVGLAPLIGVEIEVAARNLAPESGFAVAVELAEAILRAGEMPEHGEELDFGGDAVFTVQRRPSGGRTITLLPSASSDRPAHRRPAAGAA